MGVFRFAYQPKLLLGLYRKLHTLVSVSRVGSQVASYHFTSTLLSPEDSGLKHVKRKRLGGSNASRGQYQPSACEARQERGRSAQSKSLKNEMFRKQEQGRKEDFRVSSELRKLCLEDYPPDKEGQARQKPALDSRAEEIVFGIAPCLLALIQGRRKASKLFVKHGEAFQRTSVLKVCEEAHRRGVQISWVSKNDLNKMCSGGVHQGVCLQASPLSYLSEDAALTGGTDTPLWLVLEKIQDPMNLGAILRSAYFLGVDRVVSSLRHSCPLSPVVSKASSGVMEVMGVYGCENLEDLLKMKVAQGWQAVGTVGMKADEPPTGITSCTDFHLMKPTLLLMGSEGDGLSQELLPLCQTLVTIPAGRELTPGIESLNVSVAAGILLHSLLLSRRSTS